MERTTIEQPIVRHAGEGEKYWFLGGGIWTWKTHPGVDGELSIVVVDMDEGKMTPLHTHPIAESLWVLDGRIRYHIDGREHLLEAGDFVLVPANVPHAFRVTSAKSKVLSIQASNACHAFYLGASEPLEGSNRETDFDRIAESGRVNGGFTLLGPPPFQA